MSWDNAGGGGVDWNEAHDANKFDEPVNGLDGDAGAEGGEARGNHGGCFNCGQEG